RYHRGASSFLVAFPGNVEHQLDDADEPVLVPPRQPRTPHSREHRASRKRRTPGNVEHQLDEVDEPVLAPPRQPPEHPPSNVELPGTSSFPGTSSTSSMKGTSRCSSLRVAVTPPGPTWP